MSQRSIFVDSETNKRCASTTSTVKDTQLPSRRIFTDSDLDWFRSSSPAYKRICRFVEQLCASLSEGAQQATDSGNVALNSSIETRLSQSIIDIILTPLEKAIMDFPPLQQTQRFGNKGFAEWHAWLVVNADRLVSSAIQAAASSVEDRTMVINNNIEPFSTQSASASPDTLLIKEASAYLIGSFGDPMRIDYGTGHELAFLCFTIVMLERVQGIVLPVIKSSPLDPIHPSTHPHSSTPLVFPLFARYISTVRSLLSTYKLEPAGSHGVWGLDDYHHLAFLFGAAAGAPGVTVKALFESSWLSARNAVLINASSAVSSMAAISHPHQILPALLSFVAASKSFAPMPHCAPVLYDLSVTCATFSRLTLQLFRMFEAEVLGKRPVVQHLLFGRVLSFE